MTSAMPRIPIPGHSATDVRVGKLGYGLMNLTWKPTQTPDELAFAAILKALESGSTYLDAGEFYGVPPNAYANLELLGRFFDKYPQWAEPGKCFLSVKGGIKMIDGKMTEPDASEEHLLESVTRINAKLGSRKKMDLFQMARVDKRVPIEEAAARIAKLIADGHFTHFGLSEVSGATIRKAHKVHPVAAVEVEYSLWSLDVEANGVLEACQELNIPLIAYSPLGRGMLTGSIKSLSDIPEGDTRRMFDRFKPENFDQNLKLVDAVAELAKKKSVTPTQLALAWLLSSPCPAFPDVQIIPIPGSTRVAGVEEAVAAGAVELDQAERVAIRELVDKAEVKGGRYNAHAEDLLAV